MENGTRVPIPIINDDGTSLSPTGGWKGCFGTSKDEQISLTLNEVIIENSNTSNTIKTTTPTSAARNNEKKNTNGEVLIMTLDELEIMLERYLYCPSSSLERNEEAQYIDQMVQFTQSLDAHILKCRNYNTSATASTTLTIVGILEHLIQTHYHTRNNNNNNNKNVSNNHNEIENSNKTFDYLNTILSDDDDDYWKEEYFMQRMYTSFQIFQPDIYSSSLDCCCPSVHGNWARRSRSSSSSVPSSINGKGDALDNDHHHPITPNNATVHMNDTNDNTNHNELAASTSVVANFQLIDLTHLQSTRRQEEEVRQSSSIHDNNINNDDNDDGKNGINGYQIQLDSPAKVFHFLRSVLSHENNDNKTSALSLHAASPWKESYNLQPTTGTTTNGELRHDSQNDNEENDSVIGVLMCGHVNLEEKEDNNNFKNVKETSTKEFWFDQLEQREVNQFQKFRTGDAAPSHYLHSTSSLQIPIATTASTTLDRSSSSSLSSSSLLSSFLFSNNHHLQSVESYDCDYQKATLFIYRRLPPRDALSVYPPTNILTPPPQYSHDSSNTDDSHTTTPLNEISMNYVGTLWETYKMVVDDENKSHHDENNDEGFTETMTHHRQVATPYQSIEDIFPDIMDIFGNPENIELIVKEALDRIPLWTAWPERNHYSSSTTTKSNSNSTKYPSSWTVFPLCHTFPATDIRTRKWIDSTCACVPETVNLLKSLGPLLRTALFSRLEPGTKLNSHTGWSDLANHVCRVHIPLLIPQSSSLDRGLCGLWVDGCIENQVPGKILCFDDSKVHRAFNYTNQERIVLIIDLARPTHLVPIGTAVGGHTEELNEFIQQFT